MEQTSDKSPVLRESVMALFTEQKVDHENRPRFYSGTQSDGTIDGNRSDRTNNNGNNGNGASNLMKDLNVSVKNNAITIDYTLLQDATVTALVCSVSGIVYRQQSQRGQAGDYSLMSVRCDGLRRGQYVLYLNVNGQVTSQTINL